MKATISAGLRREFRTLRVAMQSLDRTLQRLASSNGTQERTNDSRRTIRVSSKRRAALVLQGRYMGFMRQLKPRQKAQVRNLKVSRGVQAAIKKAKQLASV
jgi:hypothetical protein